MVRRCAPSAGGPRRGPFDDADDAPPTPSVHFHAGALGSTDPQEALTARLSLDEALDWELAQPGARTLAIVGKADSKGNNLSVQLDTDVQGQATWAPDAPATLQMEAHLGEGQRVNVEASYAHDEGEMTLDLLAAHTEGPLTADITSVDWEAWWSSVTSEHKPSGPSCAGASGTLTPDSPCWAWMGKQASAHVTWDVESTPDHLHVGHQR